MKSRAPPRKARTEVVLIAVRDHEDGRARPTRAALVQERKTVQDAGGGRARGSASTERFVSTDVRRPHCGEVPSILAGAKGRRVRNVGPSSGRLRGEIVAPCAWAVPQGTGKPTAGAFPALL